MSGNLMRIVGLIETSLVDWDGVLASVIFLGGCNFNCPFCHNHQVARDDPSLPELSWELISKNLERRQRLIDGVVITGGEPLLHPEIFDLCQKLRGLRLQIKLDTNGSFPYVLKQLIELKLVDYVALDIKTRLDDKYSVACGRKVELAPIRRTIRLLLEGGLPYEFRTTLVPGLVDPEDLTAIGEAVRSARRFVLQQFVPKDAAVEAYRQKKPYSRASAEAMVAVLKPFVREARLRGKFD
ncbi:MAG: anaerobic ribonucleoside-triphosphate reductase activating protein [candidate division WOR-3 bacterium]